MYVLSTLCRWDKAQRARGKKECLLILILVENEIIFLNCRYLALLIKQGSHVLYYDLIFPCKLYKLYTTWMSEEGCAVRREYDAFSLDAYRLR